MKSLFFHYQPILNFQNICNIRFYRKKTSRLCTVLHTFLYYWQEQACKNYQCFHIFHLYIFQYIHLEFLCCQKKKQFLHQ